MTGSVVIGVKPDKVERSIAAPQDDLTAASPGQTSPLAMDGRWRLVLLLVALLSLGLIVFLVRLFFAW